MASLLRERERERERKKEREILLQCKEVDGNRSRGEKGRSMINLREWLDNIKGRAY